MEVEVPLISFLVIVIQVDIWKSTKILNSILWISKWAQNITNSRPRDNTTSIFVWSLSLLPLCPPANPHKDNCLVGFQHHRVVFSVLCRSGIKWNVLFVSHFSHSMLCSWEVPILYIYMGAVVYSYGCVAFYYICAWEFTLLINI